MGTIPSIAEKQGVEMKYKNGTSDKNTQVSRAPMRLPIDITYDTDTRTVEVIADGDLEGEVFLYNAEGDLVDWSCTLNATLTVSSDNLHILHIEGDGWTADGEIEDIN